MRPQSARSSGYSKRALSGGHYPTLNTMRLRRSRVWADGKRGPIINNHGEVARSMLPVVSGSRSASHHDQPDSARMVYADRTPCIRVDRPSNPAASFVRKKKTPRREVAHGGALAWYSFRESKCCTRHTRVRVTQHIAASSTDALIVMSRFSATIFVQPRCIDWYV